MKFLHLEDNPRDTALVRNLLRAAWPGCTITVIVDRPEFVIELGREGYDLILSEFAPGSFPGLAALELARAQRPDIPFVFFTATPGVDRALDAVHLGAADYVLKIQPDRLVPAVERALREGVRIRERLQAEAANRRIVDLFDHTPDLIAIADPAGRILQLNRAGFRLLGLPAGTDLAGLSLRDLHPPDLANFLSTVALPEAIQAQTWTGETVLLARDGTLVPVSQTLVAQRRADGSVSHLSTAMRDLTAQRREEAAVRANNERFQLVAHATNDSIWDWNLLTDEIWWSESYEAQFGHPRTALESSVAAWKRHIHPDDLPRVETSLGDALTGGRTTWKEEYRYSRANGTYAEVLDRGRILRDPAGRPCRMIASMLDITERKQAEHRVRELIELLDRATDAILVSDLEGRVTFWNRGAERLSGFTAHEARGRQVEDLFGPEARPKLAAAGAALETRDEWRGELHLLNREARPVISEFSTSVVRDDRGRPKARLAIVTDITERKKLEDRFLRAQRLESVGMLAAGIAHDLNNVLSPILMGAPILREHITDAGDLQLLAMFEKSAERGAGLVRQILSFAHGVSGEPRQLQVKHLLRDLSTVIAETFPKNIRYESHVAPNLWLVTATPTQIHQVLLNLCVNARDSMPAGGTLSLRAENCVLDDVAAEAIEGGHPGAWLVLTVEDTGTGIPSGVMTRIWEPFYTTKESGKGTGLGLSTVRGIVETHHGFITVDSEVGRGTRFRVFLPAAEGSLGEPSIPTAHTIPRSKGELILVVDDEVNIRNVTTATLSRHGYRVIAARDGAEALALFTPRSHEIALIITDVHMPRLDGAAVAGVVRRLNPAVKILAASGLGSGGAPGRRTPAFADAFLSKPFNVETLLRAIHDLLHTPKGAAGAAELVAMH